MFILVSISPCILCFALALCEGCEKFSKYPPPSPSFLVRSLQMKYDIFNNKDMMNPRMKVMQGEKNYIM